MTEKGGPLHDWTYLSSGHTWGPPGSGDHEQPGGIMCDFWRCAACGVEAHAEQSPDYDERTGRRLDFDGCHLPFDTELEDQGTPLRCDPGLSAANQVLGA